MRALIARRHRIARGDLRGGDRQARVEAHLERLRQHRRADRQAHLIAARRHAVASRRPAEHAMPPGSVRRRLGAQVPLERVESRLGVERADAAACLRHRRPAGGGAAGVLPDARVYVCSTLPAAVEELELSAVRPSRARWRARSRRWRRTADCVPRSSSPATARPPSIAGRGVKRCTAVRRDLRAQLAKRAKVVERPERAAFGRRDEVAVPHLEVGDRNDGQVARERLPVARRRRTRRTRRSPCRRTAVRAARGPRAPRAPARPRAGRSRCASTSCRSRWT